MNSLVYFFYTLVVGFIRVYKWLELQILKLFTTLIRHIGTSLLKPHAIVMHCPGDPKWKEANSKKALSECIKYASLIHVVHDNILFPTVVNRGSSGGSEPFLDKIWDIYGSKEELTQLTKTILEGKIFDYYYYW